MQTYRKGNKEEQQHTSRLRKRCFYSNQYTVEDTEADASANSKKLFKADSDEVICNPQHVYCFIEFFTVFTALSELLICRTCQKNIKFQETANRGFGFKLVLICNYSTRLINSGSFI